VIVLHRAERADLLAAALAAVLAEAPADPFAPELVSVPTRGVERWLGQFLAARLGAGPGGTDGVCANVGFPFPGRLVGDAVAMATGVDPAADPWRAERMVWPLLDVMLARADDPLLAAPAGHIGAGRDDPDRGARRFATVRRIADHFDHYAVHRPAMLRAWAAGSDDDGGGGALRPDLLWQPHLWRLLRTRLDTPGPAERLPQACGRLRQTPDACDLPARVALFGLTRLPASYLDVLEALAAHRQVHLFLLHPSPALWDRVAMTHRPPGPIRRADDTTTHIAGHPLLASWGRDAREMQLVLGSRAGADHHLPHDAAPATLLTRLQDDVRGDRIPPGVPVGDAPDGRAPLAPDDRSLQVHSCHGRDRQMQVARDAILHAMADDPTLEPRDVLVMCPDVEAFAPLVHAVFGAGDEDAGATATPDLRVRLADRSIRQTNPVLGVVARLVDLAGARVTAAEVLDLASREPVRRRFDLDDDDLAQMERWIGDAGVRWGIDAPHREPYGLGDLTANTWRAGLDRLLTGVAMRDEGARLVAGVLPLDDVEGRSVDLAGRIAELLDRLATALDSLSVPQPLAAWAHHLGVAAGLLCAVDARDAWQRDALDGLLADLVTEGEGGDPALPLARGEVESLLADRLRGRPTRANFRTGHLTVSTLVPMRSVPHRMLCLVGLDDAAFPRRGSDDGDDILARDPRVGDRDRRSEDRQLLLDALMAAGERLVVMYAGRDERSNTRLPPAVPIGELLDVVDATVRPADAGARARDQVVVEHPLQPFDARNFSDGAVAAGPGPWSFDRAALAGARALAGTAPARRDFLETPLDPPASDLVPLDLLERFVKHPVETFLTERLGVRPRTERETGADGIPVDVDHLAQWQIGTRLIEARLRGEDPEATRAVELARGNLPPGMLGVTTLERVAAFADRVVDAAARLGATGERRSLTVDIALGDGRTLVGTIPGIGPDLLWRITFSRLRPRDRLVAWLHLLAITAAEPQRPWRSVLVGRRQGSGAGAGASLIGPLGAGPDERRAVAVAELDVLVDLLDRGMREPLPLYTATSAAYAATAGRRRTTPRAAAEKVWASGFRTTGEDADPAHVLVLGGVAPPERLWAEPARTDESGTGWDAREHTRFGRLSRRLWSGLSAHEVVENR